MSGHLDIDDPDLAARQFLALINADLQIAMMLGDSLDDDTLAQRRDERGAHLPARLRPPADTSLPLNASPAADADGRRRRRAISGLRRPQA